MRFWSLCMISLGGCLALSASASAVGSSMCGSCMPNGVACHDVRHYSMCHEGTPSGLTSSCPEARICTADPIVCVAGETSGYAPACSDTYCGTCDQTGGRYACISESEYAFCFGASSPVDGSARTCPVDYVCSYAGAQICEHRARFQASCVTEIPDDNEDNLSSTTTSEIPSTTDFLSSTTTTTEIPPSTDFLSTTTTEIPPSTDFLSTTTTTEIPPSTTDFLSTTTDIPPSTTELLSSTTTTTEIPSTTEVQYPSSPIVTPPAPVDLMAFCGAVGTAGRFADPSDLTCKKYIYCYLLSGQYLGQRYVCSGYFNGDTQNCQPDKPDNC